MAIAACVGTLFTTSGALAAPRCKAMRAVGAVAEDPTEAFVRLLRHLALQRRVLTPEDLELVAGSKTPRNPMDDISGDLRPVEALGFHRAFAARLADAGLDWARVRKEAKRILGRDKVREARRKEVAATTAGVMAPKLVESNLLKDVSVISYARTTTQTAAAKDGGLFILPHNDPTLAKSVLHWRNGKIETIPLPDKTLSAHLVSSDDGRSYALCFVKEAKDSSGTIEIVDLAARKSIKHLSAAPPAGFISHYEHAFQHTQPQIFHTVDARGSEALVLAWNKAPRYAVDVIPLSDKGTPATYQAPLGTYQFKRTRDGSRVLGYGVTRAQEGAEITVWEPATRSTLFQRPIPLERGRPAPQIDVSIGEDGRGGWYVATSDKTELAVYDLAKGREKRFALPDRTFGRIETRTDGKGQVSFEATSYARGAGDAKLLVVNGQLGKSVVDAPPSNPGRTVTTPDGRPLVIWAESSFTREKRGTELVWYEPPSGDEQRQLIAPERGLSLAAVQRSVDGKIYGVFSSPSHPGRLELFELFQPGKRQN